MHPTYSTGLLPGVNEELQVQHQQGQSEVQVQYVLAIIVICVFNVKGIGILCATPLQF